MTTKTMQTRVINKHDTEENWLKAVNFIPRAGELIVYDIDSTHPYCRIKMGDGTTLVNDLPFANAADFEAINTKMSNLESRIAVLEAALTWGTF